MATTKPPKPPKVMTMKNEDAQPRVDKALVLAERRGGWVVELLHVAGDTVKHRKVLTDPEPRAVAVERFKVFVVRAIMAGQDV